MKCGWLVERNGPGCHRLLSLHCLQLAHGNARRPATSHVFQLQGALRRYQAEEEHRYRAVQRRRQPLRCPVDQLGANLAANSPLAVIFWRQGGALERPQMQSPRLAPVSTPAKRHPLTTRLASSRPPRSLRGRLPPAARARR